VLGSCNDAVVSYWCVLGSRPKNSKRAHRTSRFSYVFPGRVVSANGQSLSGRWSQDCVYAFWINGGSPLLKYYAEWIFMGLCTVDGLFVIRHRKDILSEVRYSWL
jgi:hypothetical protein